MRAFRDVFGEGRIIIAMVHLHPLPGTPLYDADAGMDPIVEAARADLEALQTADVDAIMFGNENDRPYELSVDVASTAATGAAFVREIFSGAHASDMGLWEGRAADALRYARLVGREDLCLLYNVSAEFASSLDGRSLADRARSAVFSSLADAILVSGPLTGEPAPLEHLDAVKQVLPDIPVLANTGVRHETVRDVLAIADGVIVGTALKHDGVTWNPVDPVRAQAFVTEARAVEGGR